MSEFPFAVQSPAIDPGNDSRGCLTGVLLGDVRRLCLPPAPGPFGHMRPPLNRTALELSLELSYMTYTLELEPWMRSGWTDVSIQVDNRLASGVTVGESESAASDRVRNAMNAWKVARARQALRTRNPLSQLRGALRQRERSDTIKAVTMIHDAPGGRFVVAIGFMGTGTRFYDWFSNFRLMADQGFHRGFAQLTETFEQSADRILFPATAARMGRTMLTLRDVLGEMRAPDSRFSLWMAGHSQGGAVMQVFCHRLLTEWGVLPRHMVGYGFASPTVAAGPTGRDPAAYPLCHILNPDDLVPRVGALKHLGLCLRYDGDDGGALRDAAYGWEGAPEACDLRAKAETLMEPITDTPTMLTAMAALSETVLAEKTGEGLETLMDRWWSVAPVDWALQLAEDKAKESLTRMARYARVTYRTLTGVRMEEIAVTRLRDAMTPVVRELPARRLIAALSERYHPPHMLCREHRQQGAYGYIVQDGCNRLKPFVWEDRTGELPCPVFAPGYAVFAPDASPGAARERRACRPPRGPARPSARTRGQSASRARQAPPCRRVRRVRLRNTLLPEPAAVTTRAPQAGRQGQRWLRRLGGWRFHANRAAEALPQRG